MLRFDPVALFKALDKKRRAHAMSWQEVSREIGVSASTMRRLQLGGRLEVDGMLAMVTWLERTVESFTRRTAR